MVICPKCHGTKESMENQYDSSESRCVECDGAGYVNRNVEADAFCACCIRHIVFCTCEVKYSWTSLESCVRVLAGTHGGEDEVRARLEYEWERARSQGNIDPDEFDDEEEEETEEDEEDLEKDTDEDGDEFEDEEDDEI